VLAAVTLHDAMQLVRLSKPRSAAKYSLNSYLFLPTIGPCLALLGGIRAIGLVIACGRTNTELVERGGADARLRARAIIY
jgi:hypothetical protein